MEAHRQSLNNNEVCWDEKITSNMRQIIENNDKSVQGLATKIISIDDSVNNMLATFTKALEENFNNCLKQITKSNTDNAAQLNTRFDTHDSSNSKLSQKFEKLKTRMDTMETKLESLIQVVNQVHTAVTK